MATNIDIATLTAKLALDAKNFNAGVDTATQKLGTITKDNAWSKIGESMNTLAKGATIAGGAIVGASGIAVKAAVDFEDAFAGVKKTVNVSGTQEEIDAFFADLEKGILEMSYRMPVAATEIAGVTEAAGQLGIHNDSLLDFTETMIGLGSATNLSADEAATALAQFANVTQMSQKDFSRLGSSIVELGNNMATDERQIVDFATELAAAGHAAGMSEADILGIGAAMASMGLEAASSGTSFQRLTMDMTSAAASMTDSYVGLQYTTDETFDKFIEGYYEVGTSLDMFAYVSGMTAEEFSKAWEEDATSAFMAFIKGLSSQSTADQLTIFDALDIKQMREIDMLQRLAGNTELTESAVRMANDAWSEDIALTEEVSKRNVTTASQLQMVKNQLTGIANEAGKSLLPVVRQLLEQARPLLEKVSEYLKEHPDTVKRIADTGAKLLVIGTAVSGIINVVTAIGSFITTIKTLGSAISILTGGGAAAGAAGGAVAGGGLLAGLSAGIAAIAPVVLAVGAVVGAFAIAWHNDWLNCQEHMSEAVETFKKKRDEGCGIIESFGEAARVFARGLWAEIKGWWNNTVAPWFNEKFGFIGDWFNKVFAAISDWFNKTISWIGTTASTWWNNVKTWFQGIGNWIRETATNFWNSLVEWFTNIKNHISESMTNIWNNITEKLTSIWNTVTEKMTSIWNTVTEKITEIWNTVTEKLTAIKETVFGKVEEIWNKASNTLSNIRSTVADVFSTVYNTIASKMEAAFSKVAGIVESMKEKIRGVLDAIGDAWDKVTGFVESAKEKIKTVTSNVFGGYRAEGGPVTAGTAYMTGEDGPELFVPRTNGYIISAEETADLFGASRNEGITIIIQGDVYDDQASMKRKLRGAMMDVLREQVAYG